MSIPVIAKIVKGFVGTDGVVDAENVQVDASSFTGNLENTDTDVQDLAQKFNDYTGASQSDIQDAINALPSSNPNFYYERLSPGAGFTVPTGNQDIPATGDDGLVLELVGERTSVGGIRPDIPFESLWQGQLELGAGTSRTIELEATFQHFYNTPSQFDITRRIRVDIIANQPTTQNLNAFSSEAVVTLGTYNLPGGGTIEFTDELLAAPFQYRYILKLKAFQLGTQTRVAETLTTFNFLSPTIIFKQANTIIGPQGERGDPGQSTAFAATTQYATLFSGTSALATTTPQSIDLTYPQGTTAISEFGLIEIGTSRTATGNISKNVISAQTLSTATSSSPYHHFPSDSTGTARLGSGYDVYLSDSDTLVYAGGANRGYLRSVVGITFGAAATPDTWEVQSTVITPDPTATPVQGLPSAGVEQYYAYRIGSDGYLRGTEVTEGDWLLALQDTPSSTDLADWDIIAGDRFPVSSTLYHFENTISEVDTRVSGAFVSDTAADALVWLSPAVLASAPFLTPGNDPDNPRTPETVAYIGGRTDRDGDLQFTFSEDRLQNYLYVGITPSFITANPLANIDVVIVNPDSTEVARYNLADNFRQITADANWPQGTTVHFVYDDDGTNQQEPINYEANQTIEIVLASDRRDFRLSALNVDTTQNVSNLQESQLSTELRNLINQREAWASVAEVFFSNATVRDIGTADRVEYADGYTRGIDWRDMAQSTTINDNRYRDSDLTMTVDHASYEISGFGPNLQKVIAIKLQRNDAQDGTGAMVEIALDQAFVRVNTSNEIQINRTPGASATWQSINALGTNITLGSGGNNWLILEMVPVNPANIGTSWEVVPEFFDGTNYFQCNDVDISVPTSITGDHLGISRSEVQRGQILEFKAINSPGYLRHAQLDSLLRHHIDDKWDLGFARLIEGHTSKEVVLQTELEVQDVKGNNIQIGSDLVLESPNGTQYRVNVDNTGTLSTTEIT